MVGVKFISNYILDEKLRNRGIGFPPFKINEYDLTKLEKENQ